MKKYSSAGVFMLQTFLTFRGKANSTGLGKERNALHNKFKAVRVSQNGLKSLDSQMHLPCLIKSAWWVSRLEAAEGCGQIGLLFIVSQHMHTHTHTHTHKLASCQWMQYQWNDSYHSQSSLTGPKTEKKSQSYTYHTYDFLNSVSENKHVICCQNSIYKFSCM